MGGKCKTEPECTLHPLLPQVNRSPGHDDDENDDVDDDDDDNDESLLRMMMMMMKTKMSLLSSRSVRISLRGVC